jgi:hypothetical protein
MKDRNSNPQPMALEHWLKFTNKEKKGRMIN